MVEKIHFAYTNETFCVSMGLETVSESVSKDTLMCVEHNLVGYKFAFYSLSFSPSEHVDENSRFHVARRDDGNCDAGQYAGAK